MHWVPRGFLKAFTGSNGMSILVSLDHPSDFCFVFFLVGWLQMGCLVIRNPDALELESLQVDVEVSNNRFEFNGGAFVVSLGLSPHADGQRLTFTRNWLKRNAVRQPFAALRPRGRVAAVLVVGAGRVNVTRNMIDNPVPIDRSCCCCLYTRFPALSYYAFEGSSCSS